MAPKNLGNSYVDCMKFCYWALAGIIGLEVVALIKGLNGQMFSVAIGAICTYGGLIYGRHSERKKIKK